MSDARIADECAQDIQMRASEWVMEREVADTWSEDDQARLDHWLKESVAHKVAYWRANHAWNKTGRIVALKVSPEQSSPITQRGALGSTFLRVIAAVIVLCIVGVATSYIFAPTAYTTYATTIGGRKILTLTDGSHIELNTNSVLRVSRNAPAREVVLDSGEAYFDIKHDAMKPFVVVAGGRRIVDVGTRFLVRSDADGLKVSMLEGRVVLGVSEGSAQLSSKLEAGDVAIATHTTTRIFKSTTQSLADTASWRRGYLVFRHVALSDAIAEFNRYNSDRLIVANVDAAKLKIYGTFRTNDIQGFADVVQEVLHLQVSRLGDKIVMSR
jgi:transmembrane sensor